MIIFDYLDVCVASLQVTLSLTEWLMIKLVNGLLPEGCTPGCPC